MAEGMEASFCSCDYEPFEWYQAKTVKAQCRACRAPNAQGEKGERDGK